MKKLHVFFLVLVALCTAMTGMAVATNVRQEIQSEDGLILVIDGELRDNEIQPRAEDWKGKTYTANVVVKSSAGTKVASFDFTVKFNYSPLLKEAEIYEATQSNFVIYNSATVSAGSAKISSDKLSAGVAILYLVPNGGGTAESGKATITVNHSGGATFSMEPLKLG